MYEEFNTFKISDKIMKVEFLNVTLVNKRNKTFIINTP